jgi:23S rRNA (adenine2503-C2)-methyltransferase
LTDKDGTRKLLFRLLDGERIESVLIDEERRLTLCVSSQVGCALGCRFCLTGEQGYRRNLSAGEIVDQICAARRELGPEERITNLVFMGMGEPLANLQQVAKALEIITSDHGLNFSTRKVTLSTVGLVPEMLELSRLFPIKLAISLHAADNETRSRIMPINRRYPLEELLEACRQLELPRRQRITFEYLLLAGVNDSAADARKLAKLLRGLRAKINLIPFNEYPGSPFQRPSPNRIEDFQKILQEKHFTATVRQSRGTEIMAACGQLSHCH